jgi:predicted secreted protein
MIRCPRVLLWLGLLLSVSLSSSARADESVPSPVVREPLPFVGASGVVEDIVPFSLLIRTLGQADRDYTKPVSGNYGRTSRTELQTLEYPQRGLTFLVRRSGRFDVDAPVDLMVVEAPATGVTPTGLFIGQSEAAARTLLSTHYRPVREFNFTESQQLTVKPLQGSRTLTVSLRQGRVDRLEFAVDDPPWLSHSTRKFLGTTLFYALLIGIWYLVARFRGRLPSQGYVYDDPPSGLSDGARYVGVLILLVVGGLSAAFGIFAKGDGAGFSVLLGLFALLFGAACVFVVLLLLSGVESRAVSVPAKAVGVLVLLALVASKLFG